MLSLSLAVNDRGRVTLCKQAMLEFFNDSATPGHAGVWTVLFDSLTESKKVGLTIGETEGLIHTLEELLTACTQLGSAEFDPFSGHPAATRLASHYESIGEKDKAHRAIRAYGTAFEQRAVDAGPLQAMTWLQPVHDEYYKRGMSEDAERVRIALVEKGKNIGDDLTSMEVPIEITREQLRDFVAQITDGSVREALLRIAALFIPSANGVRAMLDAFVKDAPLFANFGLIHISNDHFVAHAGSIEDDPEGRLMAQLAQQIEIENLFLNESLSKLRNSKELTAEAIMCILDESPVFLKERRPLLMQGIQAYLDGDHTKAIHVIVPQIEQALRHLLTLLGGSGLKSARGGGTMQLKNLNEILRETSIVKCVPEDVRLYLLSFLADQRGQNLRNTVCHGLASPPYFTQRLSDQTLHALLSLAFFRACEIRAIP